MSWLRDAAVVDFETLPSRDRPRYPPAPVGVAIDVLGKRSRYLAFGHPTGRNNSTWEDARRELGEIQASGRPLLYHNAKFDIEVQVAHMDLPMPDWNQIHDTLPQLFLRDPRASTYKLKPSAEAILGEPPEEQDAVIDWLVEHQPVPGLRLTATQPKKRSKKKHGEKRTTAYAGAYIALAPAELTGRYAKGDVGRTKRIARHVYPYLEKMGMVGAYDLERALLPVILAMEKRGIRVDLERLTKDIALYEAALQRLEAWLRAKLGVVEDFNLNSPAQLGEALVRAKLADPQLLGTNSRGFQANKEALERGVTDPQVLASLHYHSSMSSYLSNPMRPWRDVASESGGLIYTTWHTTRNDMHDSDGGSSGARTGRLSSTPNLQNLRKKVEQLFRDRANCQLPPAPVKLPPLPVLRRYIVPYDEGDVLFGRDFSSQEWRMFAHYEDGPLCERFNERPTTDLHQEVCNAIVSFGFDMDRGRAKHLNFGLLYGMGREKLAAKLKTDPNGVKALREAYFTSLPSVKELMRETSARFKQGGFIRTWDGRVYYPEEPKFIKGRWQDYFYKALNILIQGSCAGLTKVTMRDFHRATRTAKLHLSVHDELVASAPRDTAPEEMALLKAIMNRKQLDVPMLSDGYYCERNWSEKRKVA